jgi:heme/copper-type cytochrome/quinol oxidase subunit 4
MMKKIYYLIFYKLYCFWKAVSDDNWSDWKALIIMGKAQIILLLECYIWWTVITKKGFDFPNYWLIIPVFSIVIVNYYLLLNNGRWKEYEEEFKQYPKTKSRIAGWLVFLFLLGVLVSLILAFYQMSLINWSKYR